MKKIGFYMVLILVAALSVTCIIGCTGGEDEAVGGPATPTPSPTTPGPSPTVGPSFPTGTDLKTFITGRANLFDVALWGNNNIFPFTNVNNGVYNGENVYWDELVPAPDGRVAVEANTRQTGTSILAGLNFPSRPIIHRRNGVDTLFTTEQESGGNIFKRYDLTNGTELAEITGLPQGDLYYIAFDDILSNNPFVWYVTDAGIGDSSLGRIDPYDGGASPQNVSEGLNNAHGVYVFKHRIPPNDAGVSVDASQDTFVFVTENVSTTGRVLMYNVSGWNGADVLTQVEVAVSQNSPTKMTFVPDITSYTQGGTPFYAHTQQPAGYLYWVNNVSNAGQLMRIRMETDSGVFGTVGAPEIVAQSLRQPYDVIGPDDYRYVFTQFNGRNKIQVQKGAALSDEANLAWKYDVWNRYTQNNIPLFQKIFVSRNEEIGGGGNWYMVSVDQYDGTTPLSPGNGVDNYMTSNAKYPLNGVMQLFLYDPNDGTVPLAYKADLFFSGSPFSGSDDSQLYIYENNFQPGNLPQ